MKAESTSSILGGATKAKGQPSSEALRQFLNQIGRASFYLNTIVVGLDAVEHDYDKPDTLNVSWQPSDRKAAARMARKFAVESTMVRAAESLSTYVRAISLLPRFKEITRTWNKNIGAAERLEQIALTALEKDSYLIASGMLILAWRNQIVHDGTLSLPYHRKISLLKHEGEIAERYKSLSISELLQHVVKERPTLKDVSCLIAMSINLARSLDTHIHQSFSRHDVDAWLDHYSLREIIAKIRRETAAEACQRSIEMMFKTKAPRLHTQFIKFFKPDGSDVNLSC